MSNLADWKEILAGAEEDYEAARKAATSASDLYSMCFNAALGAKATLERVQAKVAAMEQAEQAGVSE